MRIDVKPGVRLKEINDHFVTVCQVVYEVFQRDRVTPTLTSGSDGNHMVDSLHYVGEAWDWRIWGLYDAWLSASLIRSKLRVIDPCYDVVFGDETHMDNIHIEFDATKAVKR